MYKRQQFFDPIVEGIHQIDLFNVRLVMEKPFGTDLLSATKLQRKVTRYFDEENIYRCLLYTSIARYTKAKRIQVSTNGVREGYLMEKILGE